MNILYLIPARGGSKGIPHKNSKHLNGKPLILYSLEVARLLTSDDNICVSTDDPQIISLLKSENYHVPFIRPAELATDASSSYDVILHALCFYEKQGKIYDAVVLLQPTSPLRTSSQVEEAINLFDTNIDVVVSVCESPQNPYYNLYEENSDCYLSISKGDGKCKRRQDAPKVWLFNGAIYVFNVESLKKGYFDSFTRIKKYVMPSQFLIDLDTPLDWQIVENMIRNHD